jgi:tetratricopeptide (TPR) repeat protein
MRLAVFRGGFRQEAAEHIAGASIRILKRLVNKALLYVDHFGRYSVHELLRQYCHEKLQAIGAYEETLDRHAAYYADYLVQRALRLNAFDGLIYQEVTSEFDNIQMAWEYMIKQEQFARILQCIRPTWQYMSVRGRNFEATELFDAAINALRPQLQSYPQGIEIYSELSLHIIQLEHSLIDYEESQRQAQELVDLLEPLGETEMLADAYVMLIETTHWSEENKQELENLLAKARKIYQDFDSHWKQANLLYFLAAVYYYSGSQELGWKTLDEAFAFAEKHNLTDYLRVNMQQRVVQMYIDAEKYDEAEAYLDEALFILERAEWVYGIADLRRMKLNIALARNDLEEGKRQCAAIIRWHQTHAKDWQMLGTLWGSYARWFLMQIGEDERAVEIFSFVLNHPISVQSSIYGARFCLDELEQRMDEDVYEAAFERGKQLSLKQIVADAMAFLTT